MHVREYPTRSWTDVVEFYRGRAARNANFAPMAEFVARLAASPYAAGLYPATSMHTLRLYQHERVS